MGEALLGSLGHYVYMNQPDADAYILGGMRPRSEGPWRWALNRPELRFYVPEAARLKFEMDLTFPENEFRQTGAVRLDVALNGRVFDSVHVEKPGSLHYSRPVPGGLLRANAVNTVAITPDKAAGRSNAGERLGFIMFSAGFAE
jgi:hypothetical protein